MSRDYIFYKRFCFIVTLSHLAFAFVIDALVDVSVIFFGRFTFRISV